ncbi:hypothetical protein ACLKA6_002563 [Drosophila palustris]
MWMLRSVLQQLPSLRTGDSLGIHWEQLANAAQQHVSVPADAHGEIVFTPFLLLLLLLTYPSLSIFASVRNCGISLMRCAGHPVAV